MGTSGGTFVDFVLEKLAPLGRVQAARFFGGIGLRVGTAQLAMLMENRLYFVVDDATRPGYVALGMGPFVYENRRGPVEVGRYYEVPADVIDDEERLLDWARAALAIAVASPPRARKKPAPKKPVASPKKPVAAARNGRSPRPVGPRPTTRVR